jgi:hypothetical protein
MAQEEKGSKNKTQPIGLGFEKLSGRLIAGGWRGAFGGRFLSRRLFRSGFFRCRFLGGGWLLGRRTLSSFGLRCG